MKRDRLVLLFSIVLIVLFLLAKCVIALDSDFGWHMRMGEYILKNGIPTTDPLSYTMPSFPFVDHEWLSNILIYISYSKSFPALCALFTLGALASLIINFKKKDNPLFISAVILLAAGALLQFSGIRVQVISWV